VADQLLVPGRTPSKMPMLTHALAGALIPALWNDAWTVLVVRIKDFSWLPLAVCGVKFQQCYQLARSDMRAHQDFPSQVPGMR
jgi:hypothetical protein